MSRDATDNKLSDKAAETLQSVIREARSWIEAVTGKTIDDDFRRGLEDGVILCKLINNISPNIVRKINRRQIAIAHLDNLKQFLNACESLGLKGSQLFNVTDLQDPGTLRSKTGGVKHTTADRRLHNVCITLYWLGKRVSQLKTYTGPQLNQEAFRELLGIPQNQSYQLLGYETDEAPPTRPQHKASSATSRSVTSPDREGPIASEDRTTPTAVTSTRSTVTATVVHTNNIPSFPTFENTNIAPPITHVTATTTISPSVGNHDDVTSELDMLADQLLANIQAVDELMVEYSSNEPAPQELTTNHHDDANDDEFPPSPPTSVRKSIDIVSHTGSFGLQLIGGTNTSMPAQVEEVLPGLPAETSGIEAGDLIVSVNDIDVTDMTHDELIAQIKSCAVSRRMSLGIVRRFKTDLDDLPAAKFERTESSILWEKDNKERERQKEEVARIYKGHSQSSNNDDDDDIIADLDIDVKVNLQQWSSPQVTKKDVPPEPVVSDHVLSPLYNGIPNNISDEETTPNQTTPIDTPPNVSTPNESGSEEERVEGREADMESEGRAPDSDPFQPPNSDPFQPPGSDPFQPLDSDPFQPLDKSTKPSSHLLSEVMSSSKYTKISQNSTNNLTTTPISYTSKTVHTPKTTPTPISPPIQPSNTSTNTPNAKEVGTILEEEIIGEIKAKTVNRTRWTPENSRTNINRSASLAVNSIDSYGSKFSSDKRNGYERHEVVMSDPRNARVRSWSYHGVQDTSPSLGVRPSSGAHKNLACSHCRAPITHGPMMSINARNLHFHASCLQCVVCHTKLTPEDFGRTTVHLRQSLPHCSSCYSTDSGIKATSC